MITATLREALADTFRSISMQNGYATDPHVVTEPKAVRDLPLPCIAVAGGQGGQSAPEQLTNGAGVAVQSFLAQFVTKSNAQMDDLLDDARNAVESNVSPLLLVPGVEMATVTEWSDPLFDDDLEMVLREATVEVRYVYPRGGA